MQRPATSPLCGTPSSSHPIILPRRFEGHARYASLPWALREPGHHGFSSLPSFPGSAQTPTPQKPHSPALIHPRNTAPDAVAAWVLAAQSHAPPPLQILQVSAPCAPPDSSHHAVAAPPPSTVADTDDAPFFHASPSRRGASSSPSTSYTPLRAIPCPFSASAYPHHPCQSQDQADQVRVDLSR